MVTIPENPVIGGSSFALLILIASILAALIFFIVALILFCTSKKGEPGRKAKMIVFIIASANFASSIVGIIYLYFQLYIMMNFL